VTEARQDREAIEIHAREAELDVRELLARDPGLSGLEILIIGGGLSFIIGASNIHFAQRNRTNRKLLLAHEEIEQLAKVAERANVSRATYTTCSVILSRSSS
jgi:hypothetical protein